MYLISNTIMKIMLNLKKKISDKNEIISSLKKDISSLKRELLESKRESNVRIGKLNQIIKNLEDNISKSDEYLMGKNKGVEITSTDILKYKREIKTLYIEKESLNEKKEQLENENAYLHKIIDSSQEGKLSDKIKTLSTKNNKLKKDIKQFKNDIRVLNETVEERDKIIMQRDRQVQILHERLGWLPKSDENTVYEENGKIIGVKSPKNIFAELLEGK